MCVCVYIYVCVNMYVFFKRNKSFTNRPSFPNCEMWCCTAETKGHKYECHFTSALAEHL